MPALRAKDPTVAQLTGLPPGMALPPLSRAVVTLARQVVLWETRLRARRSLSRLDRHMLVDIGLSPDEARTECTKPFWRD